MRATKFSKRKKIAIAAGICICAVLFCVPIATQAVGLQPSFFGHVFDNAKTTPVKKIAQGDLQTDFVLDSSRADDASPNKIEVEAQEYRNQIFDELEQCNEQGVPGPDAMFKLSTAQKDAIKNAQTDIDDKTTITNVEVASFKEIDASSSDTSKFDITVSQDGSKYELTPKAKANDTDNLKVTIKVKKIVAHLTIEAQPEPKEAEYTIDESADPSEKNDGTYQITSIVDQQEKDIETLQGLFKDAQGNPDGLTYGTPITSTFKLGGDYNLDSKTITLPQDGGKDLCTFEFAAKGDGNYEATITPTAVWTTTQPDGSSTPKQVQISLPYAKAGATVTDKLDATITLGDVAKKQIDLGLSADNQYITVEYQSTGDDVKKEVLEYVNGKAQESKVLKDDLSNFASAVSDFDYDGTSEGEKKIESCAITVNADLSAKYAISGIDYGTTADGSTTFATKIKVKALTDLGKYSDQEQHIKGFVKVGAAGQDDSAELKGSAAYDPKAWINKAKDLYFTTLSGQDFDTKCSVGLSLADQKHHFVNLTKDVADSQHALDQKPVYVHIVENENNSRWFKLTIDNVKLDKTNPTISDVKLGTYKKLYGEKNDTYAFFDGDGKFSFKANDDTSGFKGDIKDFDIVDDNIEDGKFDDVAKLDSTGSSDKKNFTCTATVKANNTLDLTGLQVVAIDQAGNEGKIDLDLKVDNKVDNKSVKRIVSDNAAPVVSIDYYFAGTTAKIDDLNALKANGKYINKKIEARVRVTDANLWCIKLFDKNRDLLTYYENGRKNTINADACTEINKETWVCTKEFTFDGDYSLSAQIADMNEHASKKADGGDFTIDTQAPSVSVSFGNTAAQNGKYFASGRTATVTVYEHNFAAPVVAGANFSSWQTDGDTHTATASFDAEGVYKFSISGADLATNAMDAYESEEFVIDKTKPTINCTVGGDKDASKHAYAGNAAVNVTINDTNVDALSQVQIDTIGLEPDGKDATNPYLQSSNATENQYTVDFANPREDATSDGVYRMTVNAKDLAGNTESSVVDWSVNRFGSTFVLGKKTQSMVNNKYIKADDLSDVIITEINPSGINTQDANVTLTLGTTNKTLKADADYTLAQTVTEGWPAYDYTIAKKNFADDGTYQVNITSTDAAGNSKMNTMDGTATDRKSSVKCTFTVDNTAPVVSFTGFDSDFVNDTQKEVSVDVSDNMALDHAKIIINGKDAETVNADENGVIKGYKITLKQDASAQEIRVEAFDKAGNEIDETSPSILVTSNFFVQFTHTPWMIAVLVCALLAVAIVVFVVIKKRKQQQK